MSKARDLANFVSTGNPLADGTLAVADISDLTASAAEINVLDGVTASTAELNILDGVTADATELNLLDGSSAGTVANSKAVIYDGSGGIVATQIDITATGDLRLQDTTGGQYVALQAPGTVSSSYTLTLPAADGTSGQFLKTDGSGALSFAAAGGVINFTASGSITAGDTVALVSNNTVATTSAPSFGTASTASSNGSQYVTFDIANGKIAMVYSDTGNSSYGTIAIGTISGSTITWGTPVVFQSNATNYCMVKLTSDASAVVVGYATLDGTNKSVAKAATISGTTPTFGTGVQLFAAQTSMVMTRVSDTSFVFFEPDEAIAISLSGTTITAGSAVDICTNSPDATDNTHMIWDADNSKGLVLGQIGGSNTYLYTFSLSGTTITASTQYAMPRADSGVYAEYKGMAKGATTNQYLFFSGNASNSFYVTPFTYDGTNVVLGKSVTIPNFPYWAVATTSMKIVHIGSDRFAIHAYSTDGPSVPTAKASDYVFLVDVFDNQASFVLSKENTTLVRLLPESNGGGLQNSINYDGSYVWFSGRDTAETNKPKVNSITVPNALTADFVGLATSSVTNGQTVAVTVAGGVNNQLTGLTAGRPYLVDDIRIGRAISATEVLVGA